MKLRVFFTRLPILGLVLTLGALLVGLPGAAGAQGPEPQGEIGVQESVLGPAFTYQGRLFDGGNPADGTFDLQFKLYDAGSGGHQLGSTVPKDDVPVTAGVFAVKLDFGPNTFNGEARWLEIGARPGDQTGDFTILSPRQELMPTPYALALPGLRTQPNDTSPNVIGGFRGNTVRDGVVGATIMGGGHSTTPQGPIPNDVTDNFGMVGGGSGNVAGNLNTNPSDAEFATVSGGIANKASARFATVGGGSSNFVVDEFSTVGGGSHNIVNGAYATIPGGSSNTAAGDYSFAAGRHATAAHAGSFVWADSTDAPFASTAENQFLVRANGGAVITGTNAHGTMLEVTNLSTLYSYGITGSGGSTGVSGYSTHGTGVDGYGPEVGVYGRSTGGTGVKATASSGVALYARSDSGSGNIIEAWSSAMNRVFRVDRQGNAGITGNLTVGSLNGSTPWTNAYHSHDHDDRYYTQPQLQSSGTASVHWGNLSNVPAGLGNGDDDTLGSLSCGEGQIAEYSGGTWGCGDVTLEVQIPLSLVGQGYPVLTVKDTSGVLGSAATFESSSLDGTATVIKVQNVAQRNGQLIEAYNPSERVFNVDGVGNVWADGIVRAGGFEPGGSDFAEMLPAQDGLESGDVLVIGPDGQLTRSTERYQATVVGVYSTQPGIVGGAVGGADISGKVPLAVVGVVPVKVSAENGSIQPGDLLTTSDTPGHAMKAGPNPPVGTVLGKALGGLEEGTGVIQMLVMLQ